MFNTDTPAKCCSYCGGRDHDFEECPKRKADAEKEEAALAPEPADEGGPARRSPDRTRS
ncbi:MAG: hypothetical protein J0H31_18340 [Alphaproteobacteria bacterium]|nr:hypothetical protein [Alphaproteobacteria bacterium]